MVILALDRPILTVIRLGYEINAYFRGWQAQLITDATGQVGFMPYILEFAAIDGIDLQK